MKIEKAYPGKQVLCLLFLSLFVFTSASSQIGKVQRENRTLIGSAGASEILLPYLELIELTDGDSDYYNLWYRDESDPRKGIRSLQFFASNFELNYLFQVFMEGFKVKLQRITVGNSRLVTLRPSNPGEPLTVRIYYEDGSEGSFFMYPEEVENLFSQFKDGPSKVVEKGE